MCYGARNGALFFCQVTALVQSPVQKVLDASEKLGFFHKRFFCFTNFKRSNTDRFIRAIERRAPQFAHILKNLITRSTNRNSIEMFKYLSRFGRGGAAARGFFYAAF